MSLHLAIDLMIICLFFRFCSPADTISTTQFIRDPETLVSNGGVFKFGFFSPTNTTKRYVGVMYSFSITTVVWVANKDVPLNDTYGRVAISEDGNLVVLNGQEVIVWSTNLSNTKVNLTAQLLDSGNLVLRDNSSGAIFWESFHNPCDSLLPNMRLSKNTRLISWKTSTDPSSGKFSVGFGPSNIPDIFLWDMGRPVWRSGPWNGQIFTGIPDMNSAYNNGFHLVNDQEGNAYLTFNYDNVAPLSYFALNSNGSLMHKYWNGGKQDWEALWLDSENECSVYGKCGPFGICNFQETRICSCLRGYEPKYMDEWRRSNWTSGCVRRKELQCEQNSTVHEKGKEDGFLKLTRTKVPDFGRWLGLTDGCGSNCLNNCSCVAYSYDIGIGCLHWTGSLIDLQKFSSGTGAVDIYVRVPHSELEKKRSVKVVIATAVIVGTVTILFCSYVVWYLVTRKRGRKKNDGRLISGGDYSTEVISEGTINGVNVAELHIFNFEKLTAATRNFHITNKLGQGGFGPVYKGTLPDGQEIAIKRLSRSSGQGLEEFMNEVLLISKLQHRNLVRLLGCSVEREEKMLIYEYMPNRSLDAHLFDPLGQEHLDWSKRAKIIEGIGRGLLYLHRDSRLRIIHRDLKASNILLDQELNPKISDFGMARIFRGDQDQANTRRVMGTYGYMAPEYAMDGRFSEKSDVYSFGVLLLEIVSGRRNSSFYNDENTLSLLRFAWKLWNEKKITELIDSRLSGPSFEREIVRYIHVGLLCVQEFANDRPIVSTILSLLSSEISEFPTPKQPAFTEKETSSESQQSSTVNNVSITLIQGR